MEIKNIFGKSSQITFKGLWMGFMVLVLMIPMLQVDSLVRERQARQREAGMEISRIWSSAQNLVGPFIAIPYDQLAPDQKTYTRHTAYILPDELNINANISPEIRHRSIYNVAVYSAKIKLNGSFDNVALKNLNIDSNKIIWNDISIQMGLSDFRGIADDIKLDWNGMQKQMRGGLVANDIIAKGIQANLNWKEVLAKNVFNIQMDLRGSERISFAPVGKVTNAMVKSNWQNPSFTGAFLPSQPAVINKEGFEASWKILELNRNYPQIFKNIKYPIEESLFSIDFIQLSDMYSKTERSVKYSFLFIALTFAMYFFMELMLKSKVHSIQYVMLGLAMCLFYLLLLSMSEYIGFDKAYFIASTAIVSMIGLYTNAVLKNRKSALLMTGLIALLYSFIYLLIQLQERSLLIGSISLFIILGIIMYFTRNFDWELKGEKDQN